MIAPFANFNKIPPKGSRDYWPMAWLIAILAGNALVLKFNAFRIFGPQDMGGYLDACWRILRGQTLYADFIFPEGPLHLYMNVFFFRLLGFGKPAILTHLIVVHSIVISAIFLMLRRRAPFHVTVLVTLLTAPSFYWATSHPWHDQNAHLWGILAIAILVGRLPFKRPRTAFWSGWACGALAVLALMCKTNIGGAYVLAFGAVLLFSPYRARGIGGLASGIILALGLSLLLIRAPMAFLEQIWIHTSSLEGRIRSLLVFRNWLVNYYWVAPVIVVLNRPWATQRPRVLGVLFLGISFVGVFSVLTGAMRTPGNIILWGVQMALAFIVIYALPEAEPKPWRKNLRSVSIALLLLWTLVLTVVAVKYGLELRTWCRAAGRDDRSYYALKAKPLNGWRFHPWEGKPVDMFVDLIRREIPPEQSLLNLTDMYIIYALTDRDSYPGISYAFWERQIPVAGRQAESVRRNILANPPEWMIIHIHSFEAEIANLGLVDEVQAMYIPVVRAGAYLLLKKRP